MHCPTGNIFWDCPPERLKQIAESQPPEIKESMLIQVKDPSFYYAVQKNRGLLNEG